MFKKVIIVFFLMFILIGNHSLAPLKDISFINGNSILQSFHPINIAFATEQDQHTSKIQLKKETSNWTSYIVPGTVGIVLIFGIGSYWLVFRKKHLKEQIQKSSRERTDA